jgi:hypothetical protein
MTNLAKLRPHAARKAVCSLLLLVLVGGCAWSQRAAPAASTVDLTREEMFEALTSHTWCDRDFPQPTETSEFFKEYRLETGLALYRDGTFEPEYTSDIAYPPTPTRWNFQKTGPGRGILYLADPQGRTASIAVFELVAPDRLHVAGLWEHHTTVFKYGRCDANPRTDALADDLPEIARQRALAVLAGTAWPRVRDESRDEPSITVTYADGRIVEKSPEIPSREALAVLPPTVWTLVSDEAPSTKQPAKIVVFGDGRTHVTLPPSSCTSPSEAQLGLPVRRLPDGGCIEEVPYSTRYRRTGRFLLYDSAPYLPAEADLSERYVVLHFFRGQMEGVVAYVPPLRLPATIRVELWPRPGGGSGFAGTFNVAARTMDRDQFVKHDLGKAAFNMTVPAGESVQQEIRLEATDGLEPADALTLEFTHSFGAGDSASSSYTFVSRRPPDGP